MSASIDVDPDHDGADNEECPGEVGAGQMWSLTSGDGGFELEKMR